jgi:NAD(P)-dependent dehydrogenase (short-subunit alcohol dehydrogenase family)/rhamnose utilization protein RhaD (predicted bifunctional aldolase and dehydrogenase)
MNEQAATALDVPGAPGPLLDELIELARRFGKDPAYSRGGGGNASVKSDGVLYIKPSGVPLATLAVEDLVPLSMTPLLDLLDGRPIEVGQGSLPDDGHAGSDLAMRAAATGRLADAAGRRPSVELLFHALLAERFVLHTHPVIANALTCSRDGAAVAARLFGDRALWVPYVDPGLPLAHAIRDARRDHTARTGQPAPPITLLQNHGIIVAADSVAEVAELSEWVVATIEEAVGAAARPSGADAADGALAGDGAVDASRRAVLVDQLAPTLRALLGSDTRLPIVVFDGDARAARFTATPDGRAAVLGGPLTPDQIVYAGSWPLLLELPTGIDPGEAPGILRDRLAAHVAATGEPPIVVVVPGLGTFAAGASWSQADTARHIGLDSLRVAEAAVSFGGVRPLAPARRSFIEAWEAEAYRRQVAAASELAGRFAGRVAVVTGAAQGFGLAIASDLVAQGGHVVLIDLNARLAQAEAARLEACHGRGRAIAVVADVTDESSVGAAIHATVERYGGLDLLVSNAGVLRAGAVTSQPLVDFDLVTRVNYRGYFVCVRAAAPVLARQHRARPGYLSDIVEINSKSGLVGSSRNSAYAGSKFGGIGLTQSFALELVDDGIKVNAICPGNYLDGPLWSDPENGLFVQYLREGKVPGATTVEDVRRFYEAKVPMGRGCTPADVLEALHYLIAQRYETGQALPVTGGQVMLS